MLDMWKLEVVFRPAVAEQSVHDSVGQVGRGVRAADSGGLVAEMLLFPRFDGHLSRAAVSQWSEVRSDMRAGEPLRLSLTVEPPR
jgi:hypothetical protein